jgi:hypothetical protein
VFRYSTLISHGNKCFGITSGKNRREDLNIPNTVLEHENPQMQDDTQ